MSSILVTGGAGFIGSHFVLHLAAESHVDRSIDGPDAFVQTNVVGTCQLLAASLAYWKESSASGRQRFRFLHVSTDEVFGSLGPTGELQQNTPYAPNSPYAASKAAADHFVRAYHRTFGLPVSITNCSNNFGEWYLDNEAWVRHIASGSYGRERIGLAGPNHD